MKDKKKIVIGALCALIMIMAVGYALLSQQLSINGSAAITSNWQVEITNITEKEKSTGATTNSTNYTATTASFNTSLTSPGDYVLYEVTVTNKGTLDAVLATKPIVTTGNNEAIQYQLKGIKKGNKILKNNQTDTFTIKVQYNPSVTTQPSNLTSNIEVTLNYEQDLGQVSPYDAYSIGDVVEFAGSNWRVIKTSSEAEDYVTVMKETVLTNAELGNYAISHVCTIYDVQYSSNNCTEVGQVKGWNTMQYYFSGTCHNDNIMIEGITYSEYDASGCDNHNDYERSKVKELLEGTYINILGANKLKEVDGYKIRLITLEELQHNLGVSRRNTGSYETVSTSDALKWVYQNFGEGQNNVSGYWTMTKYPDNNRVVYSVDNAGHVNNYLNVLNTIFGVRPVINLLKSSIE